MSVSSEYSKVDLEKKLDDYDVLYSYNWINVYWNEKQSKESLIIWKYNKELIYKNKDFFEIVMDKFERDIAWSNILSFWKKEMDDWNYVYYYSYEVFDNLFNKWENANYYWLNTYLFSKNDVLYKISYVSWNEDNLKIFEKNIKNLNVKN